MRQFRLISVVVILSGRIGSGAEPPTVSPVPDRDEILARLAPIIAQAIARTDTQHAVFHGCYDWHSAVHGHWALLRIARVTGGHGAAAQAVEQSLAVDRLAEERELLRRQPGFERPYGRAWLLQLATEFERWAADAQRPEPRRLRALADELCAGLLTFYEAHPPSPDEGEYGNSSWALVQMHAYAVHVDNGGFRTRTETLIRAHMLQPARLPSLATDATRNEFFSRFGNWAYLVAKTQPDEAVAALVQNHAFTDEALRPITLRPGVHHLGMNWSRAWALRALSRRVPDAAIRARLDRAFLDHIRTGLRDHDRHVGDYLAYDHWVPQFAVYALTE